VNRVGIIGCGKILDRHVEAIRSNDDYVLVSVCDTDVKTMIEASNNHRAAGFVDHEEMIQSGFINFVVIATPNSLHFEQAMYALENNCDVLIEKPATLDPSQVSTLKMHALKNNRTAYTVLQVRLNSCIQNLKKLIDNNEIGEIRGVSLVQRWQRPKEYFSDWRGEPLVGGGILHECGIHYLDILCYLFGRPKVVSSKIYNTKHKDVDIEDTVYSILDYGEYGGNIEVTISSEPKNLECSLSIVTDSGFIKLGGKAMNVVEDVNFVEEKRSKIISILKGSGDVGTPNSYGNYAGSCPNHPSLYKNIQDFDIIKTSDVLHLIDDIYSSCGVKYYLKNKEGNHA
jgi:UDP-N-acetyl-2-amino-2-deoxyglucuronate dehydrogenase